MSDKTNMVLDEFFDEYSDYDDEMDSLLTSAAVSAPSLKSLYDMNRLAQAQALGRSSDDVILGALIAQQSRT